MNEPDKEAAVSLLGQSIGRYRILERLGEGGCGVVFVAEQSQPVRRRVALKIIKPGMDTEQVVARFEAERQALAMMDHPNIAKVLDGGATELGRPYFVMELVRGTSITDYCDRNQLSTQERLKLFVQVCHAIQHAHQKGIIHRDIKPSNILVTLQDGAPVPMVIDFGIAKAIDGRLAGASVYTQLHQFMGTPAYMSPEQAEMSALDIDTRSDIYSLGVLLYELLTGKTPFDASELLAEGLEAMRRTIRELEPERPSTKLAKLEGDEQTTTAKRRASDPRRLVNLLQGDLDWIALKCLEKDRTRRYATVHDLAQDLGRHLNDEPVLARPPGAGYRASKFFRRHRRAVLACGAIALLLVATATIAIQSAVSQSRGRTLAERQRRIIEAVNEFFIDEVLAAAQPQVAQGKELSAREALDRASETVSGRFVEDPAVEAAVRIAIGRSYRRLGRHDLARPHIERAYELCRAHLPPESELRYDATTALGRLQDQSGDHEAAERLFRGLVDEWSKHHGEGDERSARAMYHLGAVFLAQKRWSEAESWCQRALSAQIALHGEAHLQSILAMNGLAYAKAELAQWPEAQALQERTLELCREVLGPRHPETLTNMNNLALLYRDLGRVAESASLHEASLALHLEVFGEDHPATHTSRYNHARALARIDKPDEAIEALRVLLDDAKRVRGSEHRDTLRVQNGLAEVLIGAGRRTEAEAFAREHYEIAARVFGARNDRTRSALKTLIGLYEGWEQAEPGQHAAELATWRERLSEIESAKTQD